MDFEADGKAGYHGNPEPGNHRLLDSLTALEDKRVVLRQVRRVEHAFDYLA